MTGVAQTLAFARLSVLRLVRDRGNLFFVFILPMLLILLIGAQFGGGSQDLRLGVLARDVGPLGQALVNEIGAFEGVDVTLFDDSAELTDEVARGNVTGGLVLPPGYDEAIRHGGDQGLVLEFVGQPDSLSPVLQSIILPVISRENQRVTLADLVRVITPAEFGDALAQADVALGSAAEMSVVSEELGSNELGEEFGSLGQFDLGAVQQLLLFVFLTTFASAVALLQAREYGVATRLLSYPTTSGRVIRGEAMGRFTVAMTQGLYIVLGTLLMFGVDWGDPVSAIVILAMFAAVSAGAAMLLGAVARTEAQVGAVGVGLGLVIAALGGSMLPREFMPESMRAVSLFTPHAWAYDAFADVVRRDATVLDILPQLGVLAAMAAALLALGGLLLHRTLTHP